MTDTLINTVLGKKRQTYEFATQELTLNCGKKILRPVTRLKRRWFPYRWERITCTYGRYEVRDLDWEPDLTAEECQAHIDGYKAVLVGRIANEVKSENLIRLHQQII